MRRPSFSRTGSTSPLGKLDAELPKQRISGLTLAKLQEQASSQGRPLAEYVRLILDLQAHGVDTLKRMQAEDIDRVVEMRVGKR